MENSLFRKESLERLASPERLDSLMEVVNPRLWVALAACLVLLAAALAWGILGRVADEVAGEGLLTRQGGVYQIDMPCTGELTKVMVKPGEAVAAGQLLARVARPELAAALAAARARLAALRRRRAALLPLLTRADCDQAASLAQQTRKAQADVRAWERQAAALERRAADLDQALAKGLITPDQHQDALQALAAARDQEAAARARIPQLRGDRLEGEARDADRLFQMDQQLAEAAERVAMLERQLELESRLTAPAAGRVLELVHRDGDRLPMGSPVLRLEGADRPLTCYLFIPDQGKRLQAGMAAQLNPAGVRKEEFGSLLGSVRWVSPGPMGLEAITSLLRNPRLADQLGGRGDAYLVEVALQPDPGTPSGLRWSSRQGPPGPIGSGTLVAGRILVRRQAPLTLVLPALKRWLLGG